MDLILEFLKPYAIVVGTAAVLYFVVRPLVKLIVGRTTRWSTRRVVDRVRRGNPVATVAPGANAWSCGRCRSVNRRTRSSATRAGALGPRSSSSRAGSDRLDRHGAALTAGPGIAGNAGMNALVG